MTFDFTPTEDGLRIHDQIENVSYSFLTDSPVTPTKADVSQFSVPLDSAVEFEVSKLTFQQLTEVRVRDYTGEFLGNITYGDEETLEGDAYELDIEYPSFKCYLLVRDTFATIDTTGRRTTCTFGAPCSVTVGVRSYHEQPAGVVTTTRNPEDIATAISTFGSALKTRSPERSFPTLRGHPPELTVGTQLSIPDSIDATNSELTIEVPEDYAALFTISPLAYYLDARVEIGDHTRLHLPDSTHQFDATALATDVLSVLRHCFLLDCIVRTEGLYDFELRERRILESDQEFAAAELYELPLAERTEAYLSIKLDVLNDRLPWPQITDVAAIIESIPMLPYLSYALSAIRSPPEQRPPQSGTKTQNPGIPANPEAVRSFVPETATTNRVVRPADAAALHTAWLADGLPIGGSKPTLAAAVSGTQTAARDGSLDVHLVCNEPSMAAEFEAAYGTSELDSFSISTHHQLAVDELLDVLQSAPDFLHYVGHVDAEGIRCSDGYLDARTISNVSVRAFLLNGCTSVEQGIALLNHGGIFGIVTTDLVDNNTASDQGRAIARLLDRGFTPADTLTVLEQVYESVDYSILGDANHRLCTMDDTSTFFEIQRSDVRDDAVLLTETSLPNDANTFGSVITSRITPSTALLQGSHDAIVTRATLNTLTETGTSPLIVDGELRWLNDFEPDELWTLLKTSREESA